MALPTVEAGRSGFDLAALSRRPERDDDAPFLLRLFSEAYGAMFDGLDPPLRDTLIQQQVAGQAMTYRTVHSGGRFEIVELGGVPVGRLATDLGCDALTLVDIAFVVIARNRGIGTYLLRDVFEEADAAGVPVRLTVSNDAALRLYMRLGFVEVSRSEVSRTMKRAPAAPSRTAGDTTESPGRSSSNHGLKRGG